MGLRKALTLTVFTLSVVGFGVYGFYAQEWFGWRGWLIPLGVLVATGMSELIQVLLRQRLQSTPALVEGKKSGFLHAVTTTDLIVSRYRVTLPGWAGPGLRVVHLTDFHVTDQLPLDYYQEVVKRTSAEMPDLVVITGDFMTSKADVNLLPSALGGLQARLGVFAILGNHDGSKAPEEVTATMERMGVTFIGGKVVRVEGHPALALAGDELPWGDAAPLEEWHTRADEALFVLTHTPDNIYRLAASPAQPQAVFGGHFHGGQFRLPGFGPVIVPSVYGRRFVQGHFLIHKTHLFVSAGLGAASPPVRLYCQPELIVVDFD